MPFDRRRHALLVPGMKDALRTGVQKATKKVGTRHSKKIPKLKLTVQRGPISMLSESSRF
jgi:hypothetical protein